MGDSALVPGDRLQGAVPTEDRVSLLMAAARVALATPEAGAAGIAHVSLPRHVSQHSGCVSVLCLQAGHSGDVLGMCCGRSRDVSGALAHCPCHPGVRVAAARGIPGAGWNRAGLSPKARLRVEVGVGSGAALGLGAPPGLGASRCMPQCSCGLRQSGVQHPQSSPCCAAMAAFLLCSRTCWQPETRGPIPVRLLSGQGRQLGTAAPGRL